MYVDRIDMARKAVVAAMAVCGVGAVVCIRQDDYLTGTLRYEPGMWRWGAWTFGIGVCACFVATFVLVIEYLARSAASDPVVSRPFLARLSALLLIVVAVGVLMTLGFGWAQGVGGVVGGILLLAALRERRGVRMLLAVLSSIVFGLTLWSTQSAYQYARRNAGEVVAAGRSLLDQWPKGQTAREIEISDPRVPKAFHDLAASRVWIDERTVSVYVPARRGFRDREFLISRASESSNTSNIGDSVWIKRPSNKDDMVKICDGLWMTDY
jgi:hypothetical protein